VFEEVHGSFGVGGWFFLILLLVLGIPGPLADQAAPSPGAPLERLSFGYFDQPFWLL
jgi:hypothetical protein